MSAFKTFLIELNQLWWRHCVRRANCYYRSSKFIGNKYTGHFFLSTQAELIELITIKLVGSLYQALSNHNAI